MTDDAVPRQPKVGDRVLIPVVDDEGEPTEEFTDSVITEVGQYDDASDEWTVTTAEGDFICKWSEDDESWLVEE